MLLCLLAISSTGCKPAQIRAQLNRMIGHTIVLPERITCVYKGDVFPMEDSIRNKAKLVIYIDSSECHTCRLSQLPNYERLYHLADSTKKFDLVIMLGNTHFESITLVQYLSDLNLDNPIYVDNERVFRFNNPIIPDESLFHTFFLTSDNKIKFVGDPIHNERVMAILERTLKTN